ncbi:hypothetical protein [Paenibacillus sp. 1001270B_150601_E10]|uniref:hypothetical protein n=1 Tax=Paenibacillus sp. 1001270B_150601_E10 TaxID=2787079 RepID=UPI00189E41FD|nr:hypothetical protein [Paenibacillus sp. 1001270B_150601_E10]
MKKVSILLVLSILVVGIFGCENLKYENQKNNEGDDHDPFIFESKTEIKKSKLAAETLEELIRKAIESQSNIQISDVKIDWVSLVDDMTIATFIFEYSGNKYIGYIYSEYQKKYLLNAIDISQVNLDVPFTFINATGQQSGLDRNYHVYYGYLNNREINKIEIIYNGNIRNVLKIDGNHTFLDVTTGSKMILNEIIGLDKDENEIHRYKF